MEFHAKIKPEGFTLPHMRGPAEAYELLTKGFKAFVQNSG